MDNFIMYEPAQAVIHDLPVPEDYTIPELCNFCEEIVLHQVRAHRNRDDGSVSYPHRKGAELLSDGYTCALCNYCSAISEDRTFNFAVSMSKGSAACPTLLQIARRLT